MILIFSGTRDGKQLVYKLLERGHNVVASTATEYGGSLYTKMDGLRVYSHRLGKEAMLEFVKEINPSMIIDASHPYATELKNTIIYCAGKLKRKVPLLRFEREESCLQDDSNIIYVDDYVDAAKEASLIDGNILLTTGSKTLDIFTENINCERIFARILPKWEQVRACEELGIKPSNIIAIQGPFSEGMNLAMIDKYNASVLVTKESGSVGGTMEKISAALEKNIKVILIRRPSQKKEYKYFSNIDSVIKEVDVLYGK